MAVFTLPSLPVVFKLIKDKFGPSKMMSREAVRRSYQLVKVHDRVGRMADTQEFLICGLSEIVLIRPCWMNC